MAEITEDDLIIIVSAAMARAIDGDKGVNDACVRVGRVMGRMGMTGEVVTVKPSSGEMSPAVRAAMLNTKEMLMRVIMRGGV